MATSAQIAALRSLIGQQEDVAPYTDATLAARIDDLTGDLDAAARDVWIEKAAQYADLVDTTEGGSSRKMGDLHEQALNMVSFFGGRVAPTEPDGTLSGARIFKLRR